MCDQIRTVTVSQVNTRIANTIAGDTALRDLYVVGVVSGFKLHYASGHIYFTLKDEQDNNISMKCVMFRQNAQYLDFAVEDGMTVIVRGKVSVYKDSVCQIYVAQILPTGIQNNAFEELRARLEAEGLFNKKRPLPAFIRRVCVITSDTGAAIGDILSKLSERLPLIEVIFIPSLVQGIGAPASLISALDRAQSTGADVIIIGRGGGSKDELSCFNDENLARRLYQSDIPTISAVGHEYDFSITDFVADMRARNPTDAAVMVTPKTVADYINEIDATGSLIYGSLTSRMDFYKNNLDMLARNVKALSPEKRLENDKNQLDLISRSIYTAVNNKLADLSKELIGITDYISAVNPLNVLKRGYSITMTDNKTVSSVTQLNKGDNISVMVEDGTVKAIVTDLIHNEESNYGS